MSSNTVFHLSLKLVEKGRKEAKAARNNLTEARGQIERVDFKSAGARRTKFWSPDDLPPAA